MKRLFSVTLVFVLACAGTSAVAEDRFENGVTTYDMEAKNVRGEVVGPDGAVITGDRPRKQHSLIKVRGNYVPELLKSVEDI